MSQNASPKKVDNDATKAKKRRTKVRHRVFEGVDANSIMKSFQGLSQCRQRHLKCLYDKWKENVSVLLDRDQMFQDSTFLYARGNTVFQAMSGMSRDVMV